MKLFRILCGAALLGLAGAGLPGCINAPDYPVVPAIDFKDLTVVRYQRTNQNEVDTLKFALDFRDGDGDLGLSDDDLKVPPYFPTNRNSSNYFIQAFSKNASGQFVPFITSGGGVLGEYDGRFKRLDGDNAKPAPIKGVLNNQLPLKLDGGGGFSAGQVVRFEISIMDRALHESNKITTPEVTLGQ